MNSGDGVLRRFAQNSMNCCNNSVKMPHFGHNLKQSVSVDMMNDTSRDILKRY